MAKLRLILVGITLMPKLRLVLVGIMLIGKHNLNGNYTQGTANVNLNGKLYAWHR